MNRKQKETMLVYMEATVTNVCNNVSKHATQATDVSKLFVSLIYCGNECLNNQII